MRSILTVLGITIGIAAVICVVAIGKAGQARVEQQLNNLGDNFVWIKLAVAQQRRAHWHPSPILLSWQRDRHQEPGLPDQERLPKRR